MLKPLDPFILRHIVVLVVKLQIQGSKSQWCIHIQYIYIEWFTFTWLWPLRFHWVNLHIRHLYPEMSPLASPFVISLENPNFFELQTHLILSSPKSNSNGRITNWSISIPQVKFQVKFKLMIKSSHQLWSHQISQPIPHDFPPQCQVCHIPSAVPAGDAWDIHRAGPAPGPTASQGRALKNDAGTSDLKNGW